MTVEINQELYAEFVELTKLEKSKVTFTLREVDCVFYLDVSWPFTSSWNTLSQTDAHSLISRFLPSRYRDINPVVDGDKLTYCLGTLFDILAQR